MFVGRYRLDRQTDRYLNGHTATVESDEFLKIVLVRVERIGTLNFTLSTSLLFIFL